MWIIETAEPGQRQCCLSDNFASGLLPEAHMASEGRDEQRSQTLRRMAVGR